MKNKKKFSYRLILLIIIFSILTFTVLPYATTLSQDGLVVELRTDKDIYAYSEDIKATFTVTNINDFALDKVKLTYEIPAGYEISDMSSLTKELVALDSCETATLEVTFTRSNITTSYSNSSSSSNRIDEDEYVASTEDILESAEDNISQKNDLTNQIDGKQNDTCVDSYEEAEDVFIEQSSAFQSRAMEIEESSGVDVQGNQYMAENNIVSHEQNEEQIDDTNRSVADLQNDHSNPGIFILAFILLGIVFVTAIKKINKKILSVIFSALLGSLIALTCFSNVYASNDNNNIKNIDIKTVINVDAENIEIRGNISYSVEVDYVDDSTMLSDFKANRETYITGYETNIVFTVEATNANEAVLVYENGSTLIGEMHDDGKDGDERASDGIYSYRMITTKNDYSVTSYNAICGNVYSNNWSIVFYLQSTEESEKIASDAIYVIKSIEAKYSDSNGYIANENIQNVLDEMAVYADSLQSVGIIINYDIFDSSFSMRFSTGIKYVYTPNIYGVDNYGHKVKMTIVTLQPCLETYSESLDEYMLLIDRAARTVNDELYEYTFRHNYDDDEVTLDRIKSLSDNQLVLWHGHGGYDKELGSFLIIGEKYKIDNPDIQLEYTESRIIRCGTDGLGIAITSKYIDEYCGDFSDSMIYLAACRSGYDSTLADVFLNKGATAVVANSETIYTMYNTQIQNAIIKNMTDIDVVTGSYSTLGVALEKAKNELGDDDNEWAKSYGSYDDKHVGATPLIFGGEDAYEYKFADKYLLTGKICSAADRTTPITEAIISIYQNEMLLLTIRTDESGNYKTMLQEGDYRIEITSEGYIHFVANITVKANQKNYMETFLLVLGSEEQSSDIIGIIKNAITGEGIADVAITIRKGWNNLEQGNVVDTFNTDTCGEYITSLPLGYYTLSLKKDGYISSHINVIVQMYATNNQDGTMTPVMRDDEYRIVLTWGSTPKDLDSHMEGMLGDKNFHVYFSEKVYDDVCLLDVDEVYGYGPETVTLIADDKYQYNYYVHKFSLKGSFEESEAQVKIYHGDSLVGTFYVPTDQGDGRYWNVFKIVDGNIIIENTITESYPFAFGNDMASRYMLASTKHIDVATKSDASDDYNDQEDYTVCTSEATRSDAITEEITNEMIEMPVSNTLDALINDDSKKEEIVEVDSVFTDEIIMTDEKANDDELNIDEGYQQDEEDSTKENIDERYRSSKI